MRIHNNFCSRQHTERTYLGTDGAYHLEDSDLIALQNGKHPKTGKTVANVDWTCISDTTALGTTVKTVAPTVSAEDRRRYHDDNALQYKRHHWAMKMLADPDLKRKRFHKVALSNGKIALDVVCYWEERINDWVAFTCEGYVSQ